MHFSAEWSRTATQNNNNTAATTVTPSAPRFASWSSSVISDGTNSCGTFTGRSLQCKCNIWPALLYVFHTQLHQRCVGPPQALCLRTAEYLTASATTSSSTRFTNEICEARPGNSVEVIIHSDKHEKLSVLHKMKVLRVE